MNSNRDFHLIYSLTVDDMIEATSLSAASARAQAQFIRDYRKGRAILVISAFLVVVLGSLFIARSPMTFTIPLLATAAVLYAWWWFRSVARAPAVWMKTIEKHYRAGVYKFSAREQSIDVSNGEIINRFEDGESRYRLDAVREVTAGEQILLVQFDSEQEWIVPKRALQSDNEINRFISTLKRHPGAPPTEISSQRAGDDPAA